MRLNLWDKPSSIPHQHYISAKIQKIFRKSDLMNEFCLQDELDLTLFIWLRIVDGHLE